MPEAYRDAGAIFASQYYEVIHPLRYLLFNAYPFKPSEKCSEVRPRSNRISLLSILRDFVTCFKIRMNLLIILFDFRSKSLFRSFRSFCKSTPSSYLQVQRNESHLSFLFISSNWAAQPLNDYESF